MATFNLEIAVDNAAFDPEPGPEIARLLRAAANVVEDRGMLQGSLRDYNGNTVGTFYVED